MNNILVPLGTNPDSHETLQYAIDFAADFGAKIFVMDVFSLPGSTGGLGNVTAKITENTKTQLKEVIAKVDQKGVDISMATYKGELVDGLIEINRTHEIDLVILRPQSNDIQEELYLGTTSGSIIKKTNISALIVPRGAVYKPYAQILTAFKSGILKRNSILDPLVAIKNKHRSKLNLLLVKTPGYTEEDLQINTSLLDISDKVTISENATTYQGVLEHFKENKPDLLCVFRRKRGFFKKLWEKSTIDKAEFYVPIPVLVLRVKKY